MQRLGGFIEALRARVPAAPNSATEAMEGLVSLVKSAAFAATGSEPDDLGLTYVASNIIIMGFPCPEGSNYGVPIDAVAEFLKAKHPGRFMVWNLSEKQYDYSKFDDQVFEFLFPGYPAPPLDKIFSICKSLDGWLRADEKQVAVVHCQTGRGRTVTAVASYLAWIEDFNSPIEAAKSIAVKLQVSIEQLLIPSQRRYLGYVSDVLNGRLPSTKPLVLDKIIMNSVPRIDFDGSCTPYVQVFKYASLVHSTAQDEDGVKTLRTDDLSAAFSIDAVVEGDILVRIRHVSPKGERQSIMSFHTGFCQSDILRLTKDEVDGSCIDPRFSDEFFLDLVFRSAVDTSGTEKRGSFDAQYWKDMIRREKPVATNHAVPQKFSLFDEVTSLRSRSPSPVSHPEEISVVGARRSTVDDLEAYVLGIDDVDMAALDVNSDAEDLLAELQREIAAPKKIAEELSSTQILENQLDEDRDFDAELQNLIDQADGTGVFGDELDDGDVTALMVSTPTEQ